MIKKIIYAAAAVILFVIGKFLLGGDFTSFFQWWITIFYIGILFLPLTNLIFHNFHDKGYLFSKAIGIAITGYLMWLLSSLHMMKFTAFSCVSIAVFSMLLNWGILFLQNKKKDNKPSGFSIISLKSRVLDSMIGEELLFLALFLLFTYIRGFKPEAYGTEKFMDYGFMTSMMRSEYMPPQDFWFSGTNINYYYVGQYLAVFLTKLSFVRVNVGYNLMLMMGGALAFALPYSLVYNITSQFLRERERKVHLIPLISGILGGAGVCIAGNMHYPTYQWFEPWVRKFFGMEASNEKYWFPDATRFIGYHPETTDKTIHEFPAYSFVLGDLHAHVINITFVLTVLAILFAWMCSRKAQSDKSLPIWKEVFHPAVILIAFFIGLFHTTNFWDFPIYFVVSGAVILFTNLAVYNFKRKALIITALHGIFVIAFSEIVSLLFTLRFNQISTNICLVEAQTPLNQLVILWGLPIFTVVSFLCFVVADHYRERKANLNVAERKHTSIIQYLFKNLPTSDLFIITIGLCAVGLILLPEVVYVQDIYSGDYKRANTMFKLTYQAFIMFGICFGYILLRLLLFWKTKRQRNAAVTCLILFLCSLFYIQNAVNAWYGNIFNRKGYEGLDAAAFMETTMPDDALAINWLNENITEGMPVVLEANGDSYTDYERVSVMTGLPTILGWHTHEWLWKSDTTLLDERAADIEKIYTSTNKSEVLELLNEYDVSYLYVGKLELDKYKIVNHNLLKSLGEVVFSSPATSDKAYETYIVQIKD
jgi:YYY domain-containing protein